MSGFIGLQMRKENDIKESSLQSCQLNNLYIKRGYSLSVHFNRDTAQVGKDEVASVLKPRYVDVSGGVT